MRKALFIITLISLCIAAHSQTTENEYNYITKGYKSYDQSGTDLKSGYYIQAGIKYGHQTKSSTYLYDIIRLMRKDNNELAALIVKVKKIANNYDEYHYLCIPTKDTPSMISLRCTNDLLNISDGEIKAGLNFAFIKYIQLSEMNLSILSKDQ